MPVACSTPSTGVVNGLSPATNFQASFTLVTRTDRLAVLTGDRLVPVRDEQRFGAGIGHRPTSVAVGNDAIAVVDGAWLGVIRPDGSANVIACARCTSVAAGGDDLVVLRSSLADELAFELVRFSQGLEQRSIVTARQVTERTSPDAEPLEGAELMAANATTAWIAYSDRFGFTRGGSRTVAAYSADGSLVATTRILGTIYHSAVSADGRFLAVADGGSGGACITDSTLDVIDLTTMGSLDTAPRIPVRALLAAAPDDVPSLNFTTESLSWRGSVAVAVGITSRGNEPGGSGSGCGGQAWARRYDSATQRFTDAKVGRNSDVPIGPTCRGGWHRSGNGVSITSASGAVWQVDGLVYAPPPAPQCKVER
jgi:hypothetical protein